MEKKLEKHQKGDHLTFKQDYPLKNNNNKKSYLLWEKKVIFWKLFFFGICLKCVSGVTILGGFKNLCYY